MSARTRRQSAEAWASDQLGSGSWHSEAISSDASFRSYYRLRKGPDSFVVMDSPPEQEPVAPFLDIAARLRAIGLHAPAVLAADESQGLVLLEDLGQRPYHRVLDETNACALFGDAISALVTMQATADSDGLDRYDAARLMQELDLFPDWFLSRHWRVEPTEQELDAWDHLCALLIRWALDQPQVFCHRDFMPRNLMVSEPNPGVIDFQDAVLGPISYDPVCLFRDAFLSWPVEQVEAWLEDYRLRGLEAGLALPQSSELWRRTCDLMGVQRHLKVLGIFARIRYRDGKPAYLDDAPRFFDYLAQAIQRNPELEALRGLLAAWGRRRQLTQ